MNRMNRMIHLKRSVFTSGNNELCLEAFCELMSGKWKGEKPKEKDEMKKAFEVNTYLVFLKLNFRAPDCQLGFIFLCTLLNFIVFFESPVSSDKVISKLYKQNSCRQLPGGCVFYSYLRTSWNIEAFSLCMFLTPTKLSEWSPME